ncbi:alpha/beta hydrolase family esterase [Aspergillus lucknowensis]|uniref:Feruloyl esterase C n=1 Tax=Aspergillus lucknowensis TaxID=176173 RepID=A0ABR4LCN4_9EURO
MPSLKTTALLATGHALLAAAACGDQPTLVNGYNTIDVNGQARDYILQLPDNYDPATEHRFVIAYHWRDGTMDNVAEGGYYGLSALAASDPTIFIAPQGFNNGWANTNGEDIAFTDALLETLQGDLCIDSTRIFATGWSWGGGMSYSLACSRPEVVRAVAVLSGAEISGCDGGTTPVAYFGQHGVHDSVLPIDMGHQLRDKFVELNGCDPGNPEEPAQGSGTHIVTDYTGCTEGYPVEWVAFDGDHEPTPSDAGAGESFTPELIWTFFTQF